MKQGMHRILTVWALCLPAMAFAQANLPRSDAVDWSTPVGMALDSLLTDYTDSLPKQVSFNRYTEDNKPQSWSKNRAVFQSACAQSVNLCGKALRPEFDALTATLQQLDPSKHEMVVGDAILASALADLCESLNEHEKLAAQPGALLGFRCEQTRRWRLSQFAANLWRMLGYDELLVAFNARTNADQAQWREWVVNASGYSIEHQQELLQALKPEPSDWVQSAYFAEALDDLNGASSNLMLPVPDDSAPPENRLHALTSLARVSAKAGQLDRAERWWTAALSFQKESGQFNQDAACLIRSQRYILDSLQSVHRVALPNNGTLGFNGHERLEALIKAGCPFSYQAEIQALNWLIYDDQSNSEAVNLLQMAIDACASQGHCRKTVKAEIDQLMQVALGSELQLEELAQYWRARLASADLLLGNQYKISWALAYQLLSKGRKESAFELLKALDKRIDMRRSDPLSGEDLARYDDVKLLLAKLQVGRSDGPTLKELEALRGQSLLRKLRIERWRLDTKDVVNPAAKAQRDADLGVLNAYRQTLLKASRSTTLSPLLKLFVSESSKVIDANEAFVQTRYVGRLLAAKDGRDDWLGAGWKVAVQMASWIDPITLSTPIANDEAYLSWLRVPGGYVATVLANVPAERMKGRCDAYMMCQSQQFIPFSEQDEATLGLFVKLLGHGTTADRGVRRAIAIAPSGDGLYLDGKPLWRTKEGAFINEPLAPPGATRVTSASQLSDALFERLITPLGNDYLLAKRLIISPDGGLSFLPFEALTRQGVPFLELTDIGYVQSLSVLEELKKRDAQRPTRAKQKLLTVADPDYSRPTVDPDDVVSSGSAPMYWPQLAGTRQESTAIGKLFSNRTGLLGADANKVKLGRLEPELKQFQVIHFATHGYVTDKASSLVLSTASEPRQAMLRDQDILSWSLASDLVLLSACNTGLGRQQSGDGVVGLPYAFFMAGNLNTLMSLWSVDDAGTAAFIPAFMQRVQAGEDHFQALANVKRAFARGDYGSAFANPRIWSAFVLYGAPITSRHGAKS